jgi:hypothetical protein
VDNPKLTNQANPDALSPAPPASSPPEPLIRDRFLSGMNQVLTILRDLDCPLDVRVTMAHDVADAALRSMLASSPPERSEGTWRCECGKASDYEPEHDGDLPVGWLRLEDRACIWLCCSSGCAMRVIRALPPEPSNG